MKVIARTIFQVLLIVYLVVQKYFKKYSKTKPLIPLEFIW